MKNTTLSPEARAVLGAAEDAYDYNYSEFHCCANSVAAAALRAASKFVSAIEVEAGDELLAIAAELEALPND